MYLIVTKIQSLLSHIQNIFFLASKVSPIVFRKFTHLKHYVFWLTISLLISNTPAFAVCSIGPVTYQPGDEVACDLPNGCSNGTKVCRPNGVWSNCSLDNSVSGRAPCNSCGSGGYMLCDQQGRIISPCRPKNQTPEDCNGCDDDWDNVIDNNLPPQPCKLPNGCGGFKQCNGTAGWSQDCPKCAGGGDSVPCSIQGRCNGQDRSGTSLCSTTCEVGQCNASPASEVCNNCDDDGNGIADEGLSCPPCKQ
jgi:hypothetical protein